MYNYKMIIAYDGTDYGGWQIQPNAISMQQKLESSIEIIIREKVHVTGSGRTDSGVHAYGQVANFKTSQKINLQKFHKSINGLLPTDIRVLTVETVSTEFHSRYSAKSKCYHYHVCDHLVQLPFFKKYAWHVRQKLDKQKLLEAASYLIGEKNFLAFANESHMGSASKNPVRTIYRIDLIEEENGFKLEFEGNGFLYKMVRNIVGTLIEVACGKREPADIHAILTSKDRKKAGKAAPAHGLFLAFVSY